MTTKHTQGEWTVEHRMVVTDDYEILHAADAINGMTDEAMSANLQLAAAAPDLLAALEKVMAHNIPFTGNPTHAQQVEFWQDEKAEGRGDADDMLAALAAIAKATGESL